MFMKKAIALASTCLLLAGAAEANTMAVAWTDLNLRAGPGPAYPILGVIPATGSVEVMGCLEANDWCNVSYDGLAGWASGSYLTGEAGTVIHLDRTTYAVETVVHDDEQEGAMLAVGTMGAIIGAVVAGPVGAAIGGAVGAGAGAAAVPDTVVTYVTTNPLDPIYLDGEVVVGAGIPETVVLSEVPDSTYYYAYINGVPVLVERSDRKIVYILR